MQILITIIRDFNAELDKDYMKLFYEFYNLKSLIKKPICLMNPEHLSCIDLILTPTAFGFYVFFFVFLFFLRVHRDWTIQLLLDYGDCIKN